MILGRQASFRLGVGSGFGAVEDLGFLRFGWLLLGVELVASGLGCEGRGGKSASMSVGVMDWARSVMLWSV